MDHGLNLNSALSSLIRRGRVAEATNLKQRVTAHFQGVLTEKEVLELPVEQLTGIIEVFNEIYPKQQPKSALESHIEELRSSGHIVVYGAAFHGKR